MSWTQIAAIGRALKWAAPAIVLIGGSPGARAAGTIDWDAGRERLQHRLDEVAQAVPIASSGPGGPVLAGGFPRSFAIPGSDVSLRIGGQVIGGVLWYLKGANTGGALGNQGGSSENYTDGQGSVGNLASIPLDGVPASNAIGFAHSRSSTWDFSGKLSRVFLDARGPSAYGEIKPISSSISGR